MKIKLTYMRVRTMRAGATDTIAVETEISSDADGNIGADAIKAAFETARTRCDEALNATGETAIRARLRDMMSTEKGRADLERFLLQQPQGR